MPPAQEKDKDTDQYITKSSIDLRTSGTRIRAYLRKSKTVNSKFGETKSIGTRSAAMKQRQYDDHCSTARAYIGERPVLQPRSPRKRARMKEEEVPYIPTEEEEEEEEMRSNYQRGNVGRVGVGSRSEDRTTRGMSGGVGGSASGWEGHKYGETKSSGGGQDGERDGNRRDEGGGDGGGGLVEQYRDDETEYKDEAGRTIRGRDMYVPRPREIQEKIAKRKDMHADSMAQSQEWVRQNRKKTAASSHPFQRGEKGNGNDVWNNAKGRSNGRGGDLWDTSGSSSTKEEEDDRFYIGNQVEYRSRYDGWVKGTVEAVNRTSNTYTVLKIGRAHV
jgi:hypothetical protein